jgi:hypothetical protein
METICSLILIACIIVGIIALVGCLVHLGDENMFALICGTVFVFCCLIFGSVLNYALGVESEFNDIQSNYTTIYVPIEKHESTGAVFYVDHEMRVNNLEGGDKLVDRDTTVVKIVVRKPMEYNGFTFKAYRKDEIVPKTADMKLRTKDILLDKTEK